MMDEKFFAWLDGELDPAEAAAMEARVAADPRLAKAAEQHRALASQLRAAFDPVAQAPVPASLQQAMGSTAPVAALADWRQRKQHARKPLPQWMALAATLAVGVIVGSMVGHGPGEQVELRGGRMIAAASLDDALDRQLASNAAGDVRIGLTFRDRSGKVCRSFTNTASSGLACRDGDNWRLRGLFAAPEGQGGDYRMAVGTDPNLAALIDDSIAGEPFDAAQEQQVKRSGWR